MHIARSQKGRVTRPLTYLARKMRPSIKILSLSTRRDLLQNRRLPGRCLLRFQAIKEPLEAMRATFGMLDEFGGTVSESRITTMRRCFASLSKSSIVEKETTSDDCHGIFESKQQHIHKDIGNDDIELDQNEKDFDTSKFGHEIVDDSERSNDRIWMDPKTPLEQRVKRFIDQPLGSIHHLDIKLTSLDLIKSCGRQKSFEGMKNAQDILDRLIEEKKYVNSLEETTIFVIIPDRPFKMVMYGWANMCRTISFAPQRMREVLDLMIQEAEDDKNLKGNLSRIEGQASNSDHDCNNNFEGIDSHINIQYDVYAGLSCEPTVDIYNTLLQGLSEAASRSIQAAIEAEHVLSKMNKMNMTRGWHTKPNTRSYSLVLKAYANCRHVTSGDRAESVLRDMIERHEHEKLEYFEQYGKEFDTANTELNNRMIVTPDTIAYTTVIQAHAYSDTSTSAEKALMLLNELIQSDNPALEADSFSFANTINAFSKMAAKKKSPSHRVKAAERAEAILWMMVDEIKSNKHSNHLSGSIVPFNACLNAWAQSFTPESPHRAEDLLHRMLDPDLQAIIRAHPNTVSFNTCMQAWSKACKFEQSATPERAEELLTLLMNLSDEDMDTPNSEKNWKLSPDIRSYVTVMDAYASSRKQDSVFQTRRLLLDLLLEGRVRYFGSSEENKINAYPFTIVLKAAANIKNTDFGSDESQEYAFGSLDEGDNAASMEDVFTIALKTYSELLNDSYDLGVSADHFTFSEMLTVIAKFTAVESIERRQRVEEVFQEACNAGQVSSLVVRALQKACPTDSMLADLLRLRGNNTVASIESINMFPKQWTSRVPQEFRRVSSRNDHFQKQSKFFRSKKPKNGALSAKKGVTQRNQNSSHASNTRRRDKKN